MDSIDVCISFDTTGSMYPCITQVRRSVEETVERLFKDVSNLRISIIAHGDYCDEGAPYVISILDFTNDKQQIVNFVRNVAPTYGGDTPECYELVFREARTNLNWVSGRNKALVMIGDAVPHGPAYPANVKNIDWRNELGLLLEAGINVYGVHAMPGIRTSSKFFYEEIARKTGGFYLTLDQFSSINDLLIGVCYRQDSVDKLVDYAKEVEGSGRMTISLQNSFSTMSDGRIEHLEVTHTPSRSSRSTPAAVSAKIVDLPEDLEPVAEGRFQVIRVDDAQDIRGFITAQGISFKPGRGFYELSKKSVKVQRYKEIVLRDKRTGIIYYGKSVREKLRLQPQASNIRTTETLRPTSFADYQVFVQSTSYNRNLLADTDMLYEVEDWDAVES